VDRSIDERIEYAGAKKAWRSPFVIYSGAAGNCRECYS
jgi:hypothetical protein